MDRDLLSIACQKSDHSQVLALLNAGADVNERRVGGDGDTPLHIATDINIVTLLVERGADINIRGHWGHTPIYHAVMNRDVEIVSYLLSHHASVNITDRSDKTPLHLAMLFKNNADVISQLVVAGSDVNAEDDEGTTPLYALFECNKNDWRDSALILLAAGADINAQNMHGNTILHTSNIDIDMVRFLLEHGASAEIKNKGGRISINMLHNKAITTLLQEHIASQGVKNAGRLK